MSSAHPRRAAASLLACCTALIACSGSSNQSLRDLTRGHKDAAADGASSTEPEEERDAAEPAAREDAALPAEPEPEPSIDAGETGSRDAEAIDAMPSDAMPSDAAAPTIDADAPALDASDAAGEGGEEDAAQGSDASAPRVTLTLTRGGVPVPRAYVVYHGVEQQVLGVADTDAQGMTRSELEVLALTVVIPPPDDRSALNLFTYFGVQPGDDLKLEVPSEERIETSYALRFGAYPGATRYEAGGGPNACLRGASDGAENRLSLSSPAGCLAPTDNAVLVSAFSLVRDAPVLSAYALASGLLAPAAGTTAEVQVGAFQPYQDVHLVGVNPPLDLAVNVGLRAVLGDQQLPLAPKGARAELSASAPDVEFGAPTFSFAAFLARAEYFGDNMQHQLLLRTADSATGNDITLDFAAALPPIREFLVDEDARVRPYVYWTSDPAPERDAFLFEVRLRSRDPEAGPPLAWAGLAPPGARRVRLPLLPPELLAAIPSTAAYTWQTERISEIASSRLLDYDAVRRQRLVYISGGAHLTELALDASGRTALASFGLLP